MLVLETRDLPEEEQTPAFKLTTNVASMSVLAGEFRASYEVFKDNRDLPRDLIGAQLVGAKWRLAGRGGVIAAYSFYEVMRATNGIRAPELWKRVDMSRRTAARKAFEQAFPKIVAIRALGAHPGELAAKEFDKHALREEAVGGGVSAGPGVFVDASISANGDSLEFAGSFQGQMVSYILSPGSCEALQHCLDEYLAAFDALRRF